MKHCYLRILFSLFCVLALMGSPDAHATVTTGTYSIGASGDYADLSSAIADLNSSTITGPVVFNIMAGSYSGSSWRGEITSNAGSSSTNTITFQPQSGAGTVSITLATTSSANYIFKITDAEYVTVKNLQLKTTGTSYGHVIEFGGAASYDTVRNCLLQGSTGSTSSTNRAIIFADNADGMISNGIIADTIQNGSYGIYWNAASSTTVNNHAFNNNKFDNNYYCYIRTSHLGGTSIVNNIMSATGVSGYHYGVYNYYPFNGCVVRNNTISTTNTSGYLYGVYTYYGNYNDINAPELIVDGNNITLNSSSVIYGVNFEWYCDNINVNNNTVSCNSTGSSVYGVRTYYFCNNVRCNGNTVTTTNNGSYASNYPWYFYFTNYSITSGTYFEIKNNVSNGTSNSSSGYMYPMLCQYSYNLDCSNNSFSGTGKYYFYGYGPLYYAYNSNARNNTFNYTNTGYGSTYNYAANVYNSSTTTDTFENNTINITNTSSGSIYNYACYYIASGSIAQNNTYNISTNYGTLYNYSYYGNGGLIKNNTFNLNSNSGTIYGMYSYNYSYYSGANFVGNTFKLTSNYGTTYAFGGYMPGQDKFMSNVFTTKTSGSSYLIYEPSYYGCNTDVYLINNTFHSSSTGYSNYLINRSGSYYSGVMYLYNNIFSKSDASNSNGVYINDTIRHKGDYNLYYAPSSINFQVGSPSFSTTSFDTWKQKSNRDNNSVFFDPGFVDPANGDVHPDPANPNSWSVQGRALHIDGDTLDLNNALRPKTRFDGVPDLGAYEFTPTSTPPDCEAIPATPQAGKRQVFRFGTDTVATIDWGSAVPATASMKQYTGLQVGSPMPSLVERGYISAVLNTGSSVLYSSVPTLYYKNGWLGNISSETNTKIARSTNNGPWEGYNYGNAITDSILNHAYPANPLDSTGAYTIVENARIGIRCVIEPQNLKVSNITAFTADLDWDPVFLPIGYQVIIDNNSGTPASGAGARFTTNNTLSATALTENTQYYAHVRSICGVKDTSGWATVPFKTLITCHTPDVKMATLTQFRAVIYWDTIQTATKYEYAITNTPTPPAFGTPLTTNSLNIPLAPGRDYYVYVKAYCNSIYPESEWGLIGFSTFPTGIAGVNSNVAISVYPNPATDVVNVSIANATADARIAVTDLAGKILITQPVVRGTNTIDIRQLAKGMYMLKYLEGDRETVSKFTKY